MTEEEKQRTLQQNKAIHKFCLMLSHELNDAGLDMRKLLKPSVEIPWNADMVKDHLWRPIQIAMYNKESTTQLETDEVNEVYQVINRHLAEKFGVSVPFPNRSGE